MPPFLIREAGAVEERTQDWEAQNLSPDADSDADFLGHVAEIVFPIWPSDFLSWTNALGCKDYWHWVNVTVARVISSGCVSSCPWLRKMLS